MIINPLFPIHVFEKCTTKTELCNNSCIVAANALASSCTVTHSNKALFWIKTILCETKNTPFKKNC